MLSEDERIRYLKRSYSAVDGLWFMMAEEIYGFDKALELDKKVWEVMPKIQSRFLKSVTGAESGLESLKTCFSEKLKMDGCEFTCEGNDNEIRFTINRCPWHETMIRSDRIHLSQTIGETICSTEYSGWVKEFGDDIQFGFDCRICAGEKECIFTFSQKSQSV